MDPDGIGPRSPFVGYADAVNLNPVTPCSADTLKVSCLNPRAIFKRQRRISTRSDLT